MELTLDEALQKAIKAHKAGQVQEADRLYTAILQTQPKHPDANHNMGVLAVSVGMTQQALPFFKIALEANPSIGQYWLSTIEALIKLDQLDNAQAVLDQAKKKGVQTEVFDQLEQQLAEQKLNRNEPNTTEVEGSNSPKTNILGTLKLDKALRLAQRKSKEGKFEEAHNTYQDILQKFPNKEQTLIGLQSLAESAKQVPQDPPPNQLQPIINFYTQGKLQNALSETTQMLERFPNSIALYNIAGASNAGLMQFNAAIDCYKQALKIKPDCAVTYNNIGNALKDKGDSEAAIESYKQALKIKPDYFDSYYNMGVALQDKGDSELAIGSYKQALKIKPDYADAYINMGVALKDKGDLVEAIDSFKQALKINPKHAEVWNNLAFPLQAMKLQVTNIDELLSTFNLQADAKHFQIEKSVLSYRLHVGGENAERSLNEVCSLLSAADNAIIRNPEAMNRDFPHKTIEPDKIVGLVHFGRSGTGLLHSLIDSHPEVSTMPSIYFSEFFNHSNWEKILLGGWSEMVDRFIALYEVLFDASARNRIETKSSRFIDYLGQKEGMANVGVQRDEVLRVDKALFREELNRLMNLHNHLDAFSFFQLAHTAYDKSLNNHAHKHLIFYHIHNPDTYAKLNFVQVASNVNWVMMVREPLQACEAWIRVSFDKNEYNDISSRIFTMLFAMDNVIYQKQNATGVRLEDLKESPRKTIPALCEWMGIEETESLYEMTAQGKKWWGDPDSPDYKKDGMEPFGKTSIRRKLGSVFTENDQFILRTLFYPFSLRFGYVEENLEQFKADLKTIRPLLDEMFDFEKTIAERTQINTMEFMKSGAYLYLRSGLIERWNVLAKFDTYPNMIKPLKING
jgi:tetratricopeptide (TPR) repeat protein